MDIIYSEKVIDLCGNQLTSQILKETFKDAIKIKDQLLLKNKKVAYFFIDPLINSFEAANHFYFNILECESITKINTYKSGASPIQALSDAKELVDHQLYDAVFIFGKEFLLSDIKNSKEEVKNAMNIFKDKSLIECYNLLAHELCKELSLSKACFFQITNDLFNNYRRTYHKNTGFNHTTERGRSLEDLKADLFKLTDCANPNIDFAGGLILANEDTAEFLQIPKEERIKVTSANYNMVEGLPESIPKIVGKKDHIFPHLKKSFLEAQSESKVHVVKEFKRGNLLLDVYTCYPPIPIAFLLTTGMINDASEFKEFLGKYEITINGGLNFSRAPWNNPVLNALVDICNKMKKDNIKFGLVHGNGGIGEVQGIGILEKY